MDNKEIKSKKEKRKEAKERKEEAGMIVITVSIPKVVYERFRDKVFEKTKLKKGSISTCWTEAIEYWLQKSD